MGSWDESCLLTGKSINYSRDCYFSIVIETDIKNTHELNKYASPVSMIMKGKYNDYGRVTDVEKTYSFDLFLNTLNVLKRDEILKVHYEKLTHKKSLEIMIENVDDLFSAIERGAITIDGYTLHFTYFDYDFLNMSLEMFETENNYTLDYYETRSDMIEEHEKLLYNSIPKHIENSKKLILNVSPNIQVTKRIDDLAVDFVCNENFKHSPTDLHGINNKVYWIAEHVYHRVKRVWFKYYLINRSSDTYKEFMLFLHATKMLNEMNRLWMPANGASNQDDLFIKLYENIVPIWKSREDEYED